MLLASFRQNSSPSTGLPCARVPCINTTSGSIDSIDPFEWLLAILKGRLTHLLITEILD